MALHSRAKTEIYHLARKLVRPGVLAVLALLIVGLPAAFYIFHDDYWDFRDLSQPPVTNPNARDKSGNPYPNASYLHQGWSVGESEWFYTVTQGSDLLPYSFFLSLFSAGTNEPLASDANYKRWRYLPQGSSVRNPDALPIGFTRNEYTSRDYLGLTCAACHTGQVNYREHSWRIDGGPSMADFDQFMADLRAALNAAELDANQHCANEVCKQFVARVLARGDFPSELEVTKALLTTKQQVDCDALANHSPTAYGFARLDAFGRIYNRVLRGVLRVKDLDDLLPDVFDASELPAVRDRLDKGLGVEEGQVLERALPLLTVDQRNKLIAKVFNPSNAPVSYPFLWDTPQHDYVQWNGIVANASFGGVGRNAGEVIGVFGTLDWKIKDHWSVSSWLGGQGFHRAHISYESSIYVHNLRRIEAQIVKLESPQWPADIIPFNHDRVVRGEALFGKLCARCHAEIVRDDPHRRIVASMIGSSPEKDKPNPGSDKDTASPSSDQDKLNPSPDKDKSSPSPAQDKLCCGPDNDKIGTDNTMAWNSVHAFGYSGMLRDQYVNVTGLGNVLIDRTAPVAALLTQATHGVIAEPYPNASRVRRIADWASDLVGDLLSNEIKPSLKSGDYEPDTSVAPYASLQAYKGRALNGIWATAPYLHNGSVPTLYALLLPAAHRDGDPADQEYRPGSFIVGSRELDPEKVGFQSAGYEGFKFDTTLPSNSNAGHEYGTIHDSRLPKDTQPLTKEDRFDLVEYLKTL